MSLLARPLQTQEARIGEGGPTVIWLTHASHGADVVAVARRASELAGNAPFTLVAAMVEDWNAQLSPWPAASDAGQEFAGCGGETLKQVCLLAQEYSHPVYLAGYSLAGLFSLWAITQTDAFAGVASCSGSTWFPGWNDHAEAARWPQGTKVYLSLGSKEEDAPDVQVATVGECTRQLRQRLKACPNVKATTLVMNKGGHFADPSGRVAKGIAWLLAQDGNARC